VRPRFLRTLGVVGCLGCAVAVVGVASVAAAPAAKRTKVHCTATAYNVSYPRLSGLGFANLKCSKPFGAGVQKAINKGSIVGSSVKVTGRFKNYFDDGTEFGTLKLSGKVSGGAVTVSGPVIIKGGTGAYRSMKGTGKATCTTKDAGKTYTCTVSGTATM
jgi:hypothetical protein